MTINLLDIDYYRRINPDLANFTDEEATEHFFNFGIDEGRDFSPVVDLDFYKAANLDLATAGFTDNRQFFDHLAEFGVAEGRLFSHAFHPEFYRASYEDLVAVGFDNEQLFEHFQEFGLDEGRVASNMFDIGYYLNSHPDLIAAGLNNRQALTHFSQFGIDEGRTTSPQFDVGTYLSLHRDLVQAGLSRSQAFNHYQIFGLNERRLAAPLSPVIGNTGSIDLGTVAGNHRFSNSVFLFFRGSRFPLGGDIYQFTLFRPSTVSANLSRTSARNLDISLSLFADLNGNGLHDSDEPVISDVGLSPNVSSVLPPGNYGLEVPLAFPEPPEIPSLDFFPVSFDYDANLLVSPVADLPADRAGNSIATARNLGTLTTTQTFNDTLGLLDRTDIYRFTLDAPTNVEALLDGTGSNVIIEILRDFNNNGEIEFQSGDYTEILETSSSDSEVGVILDAGTYFLRLQRDRFNNGSDTDYTLTLSPQASRLFPDGAGNTLPSAFDVGVLNEPRSFADTVGESDSTDYYQFEIETPTNVGITFDASTGSPSLAIGRDFDGGSSDSIFLESRDILQSQDSLTAPGPTVWSLHLTPGTYFARVSNEFSGSSVYDLEIAPTPPPGLPADGAGNNIQTARNLDVLTGMVTFNDSVGPADKRDVYRFVVDSPSTIDVLLEGSGELSNVRVVNDLNNDGSFNPEEFSQFISRNVQTSILLEPGVYFALIGNSFGSENVNYELSLSAI